MILRFDNVYGRIDPPVEVTVLGPCDGHDGGFRFVLPDGRIGCSTEAELSDE